MESKFEEIFNKHARTHKDALTAKEIKQMLKTNREPYDFIGWFVVYKLNKLNYNHNVTYHSDFHCKKIYILHDMLIPNYITGFQIL